VLDADQSTSQDNTQNGNIITPSGVPSTEGNHSEEQRLSDLNVFHDDLFSLSTPTDDSIAHLDIPRIGGCPLGDSGIGGICSVSAWYTSKDFGSSIRLELPKTPSDDRIVFSES
jgi:hypothetical protein